MAPSKLKSNAWLVERFHLAVFAILATLISTMRFLAGLLILAIYSSQAASVSLSPSAVAASLDARALYVACPGSSNILCYDVDRGKVAATLPMPGMPSGLALMPDSRHLAVTCAAPESEVYLVDLDKSKITASIKVGHTAMSPVISPDGRTLYVCNCFDDDISVIDLRAKRELRRIAVSRQPVAADITKDGRFLLVANQLPAGRADAYETAAVVSVIDVAKGKVIRELHLPNGSGSLKDIRVSPDGKYAAVTHLVGRITQPTVEVHFGWINANALTLIDLAKMDVRYSLLLDEKKRGAGNPWGLAWSADGNTLAVAHAGTHEVSVINFPELLAGLPATNGVRLATPVLSLLGAYDGLDDVLPYLSGARERVALAPGDYGPRSVIFVGQTLYTANYFSDTLDAIDLNVPKHLAVSIPLGPKPEMDAVRRGEFYFHDAALCEQGWQSCSSCHPGGARVDGFNWDLLNDGLGNPKNTKNLLLATKTPPSMSLGIRANASVAVRAGFKFILFTHPPEEMPVDVEKYLDSLKPVPSPQLVHGRLSATAEKGRTLFVQAGCSDCHVPGLFTDLHPHDVGTRNQHDGKSDRFYTPTLIEVWRTAPYLHDGSAVTVRDVLTTRNPNGEHGDASKLSSQQLDELCAYVLSL